MYGFSVKCDIYTIRVVFRHYMTSNFDQYTHSHRRTWRWVKYIVFGFLGIIVAGILFIKLDTAGSANFTDNVLRPIFGPRIVVGVEKIFFNLSDTTQQLHSKFSEPTSPLLGNDTIIKQGSGGALDLTPIPVSSNFTSVAHEGFWRDKPLSLFPGEHVAAYTVVRPDPDRSFAFTTLIQIDMTRVRLGVVAGTQQPGGPVGKPGPGIIPPDIVKSDKLVAAFDGGFQYRDGAYGMIVGSTTYLPLKNDLGTVVGFNDGSVDIINYTGQTLGDNVAFVRQNCPILINNGVIGITDPNNKALWGRTFSSGMYTWRTGMGLTREGNLVFAVGNNLIPETLAQALRMAGAVNAIQLDINPNWVRFNFFEPKGGGAYASTTLTKDLKDGSAEYLNGDKKDFFYLYKK